MKTYNIAPNLPPKLEGLKDTYLDVKAKLNNPTMVISMTFRISYYFYLMPPKLMPVNYKEVKGIDT